MAAKTKFTYKVGTKTIALTRIKDLPIGVTRKLRNASEEDQAFGLLEAAVDEKNLALVDELDAAQFNALQTAWLKDSGVTLGESSAS